MLTEVRFQNYKSLADVTLTLGPLTVLVGANGSGKSNIVDALRVLKAAAWEGQALNETLSSRGRLPAVVWGGDTEGDVTITVMAQGGLGYSLCFGKSDDPEGVAVRHERTRSADIWSEFRQGDEYRVDNNQMRVDRFRAALKWAARVESASPAWRTLVNWMGQWRFYSFEPRNMRPVQQVRRSFVLSETGDNLSTVLHSLSSEERNGVYREIVETLKSFVPEVEDLLSPLGDAPGTTYAAVKEKGVPGPIGTWGMSNGTLFALALSVALLTPEPPTLAAFESPDMELHPYVLPNVAEMLKLASRKTQVIVTTHSPYLLDHLPADSLVLVEKRDGKTTCRPVRGKKELRAVAEQLGVGKAWHAGHLGGVP